MTVTFWPGKSLTSDEEAWLRLRIARLQIAVDKKAGNWQSSADEIVAMSKFLPENAGDWSPDTLEDGAHIGPWVGLSGRTATLKEEV